MPRCAVWEGVLGSVPKPGLLYLRLLVEFMFLIQFFMEVPPYLWPKFATLSYQERHISFLFSKYPNGEQNLYFLTLSLAEEEEVGGGASLFISPSTDQWSCFWCRSSWLCSLPNLLRMNPAHCVRHQKRVKESADQKEQVIREKN